MIDKFDYNLNNFYIDPSAVLEIDSDGWIKNNPYIEILERALRIVEIEERKNSTEHLLLASLL